jgi:hypothetical protein
MGITTEIPAAASNGVLAKFFPSNSNRVVNDWEERGLSRPPNGHQWVRVGQQFVLVRGQDGMIARILNFD